MSIRRYKRCLAFYSSSAYLSAFAYKSIHRNRPDWLDDQWVDIEFYQRVIVCYRVFGDGDDSVDQCIEVSTFTAPVCVHEYTQFKRFDGRYDFLALQRQQQRYRVIHEFDERTTRTDQQIEAECFIPAYANDHLGNDWSRHLLDEETLERC